MTDEKELGKELLKRNGIEPGRLPDDGRKELRAMVERGKVRAKVGKVALGVYLLGWATFSVIGFERGTVNGLEAMGVLAFGYAFLLVPMWSMRMYIGQRQIQTSLADIAEQLRQLVEDQRADRPKGVSAPGPEPESETKRD